MSLISYEENQLNWAGDYLLDGSVQRVQGEQGTGMLVYHKQRTFPIAAFVNSVLEQHLQQLKEV